MTSTKASESPATRDYAASSLNDIVALTGRILLAAIFLLAGLNKVTDPAGTIGYIGSVGLPAPEIAYASAVALEIVGGALLVFGFKTRLVAAALAAFSLAAALLFHFNLSDPNQFVHFFKNVAMAGGLLQVVAYGPGRFALDAR